MIKTKTVLVLLNLLIILSTSASADDLNLTRMIRWYNWKECNETREVVWYRWAMTFTAEAKPEFSDRDSQEAIVKSTKLLQTDYYQVIYLNGIPREMYTYGYKDDQIVQIDYFDPTGTLIRYIDLRGKERKRCEVAYHESDKDTKIHTVTCSDNTKIVRKYVDWSWVNFTRYKNGKKIKETQIDYKFVTCKDFDSKGKLIDTYTCYPYEESAPLDSSEFPRHD